MNTSYEIAFVGSGIASSFTLLHLLRNIDKKEKVDLTRIAVLEKSDEFITGIPYGERSGSSVLLITDLKSFIPEPERSLYIEWLSANKERLLHSMSEAGGEKTQEWLKKHAKALAANQWEELFIPRRFFGIYLTEKIHELIKKNTESKKVSLNFLKADIQGIVKVDGAWILRDSDGAEFEAEKVILGVGSLPTRPLWNNLPIEEEEGLMVVNEIYHEGMDATVDKIKNFLVGKSKQNVAIVGANAGAVEILYKLIDEGLGEYCDSFYFLSTHGVLPDSYLDEEKLRKTGYSPVNLINLASENVISAKDIYDASQKDIDAAEALEIGARTSVGVISGAIGNLLGKLELKELANFAAKYGNEIGRRQRCAGEHYIDTIQDLRKAGRFEHIAGRFSSLVKKESGNGFSLIYKDTHNGNLDAIEKPISLVINCSGSMSLDSEHAPKILQEVVHNNWAEPNDSGIGFKVDDHLQTKGGLYVVGPMLGGNVIQGKAVWHVEHCGRIVWLSGLLAQELV
jgi:uncharacterized NAD(P)/FAD-binding protein YdhS